MRFYSVDVGDGQVSDLVGWKSEHGPFDHVCGKTERANMKLLLFSDLHTDVSAATDPSRWFESITCHHFFLETDGISPGCGFSLTGSGLNLTCQDGTIAVQVLFLRKI
jgi:hypothetical protein